ncbi:nickel-responsive transcriptional regulator NikR [Candidatus Aciduliprofundum boonei]|uniref:Putative nickel-responsive regulator n=1 Tax=Aciduliprofundum boonei (strain DSM 19572 / T469) TaxID=439481 RepID=B5IB41_ACIB4|nr:nickel-responsive transcriptional regulator NikR [Candidatus Aciduliprofundum boonei]ADD09179.1 transcriptional regulator NikR, CopG family [Aciduliprofundum boonei T469]EDY35867.1 NikR C terminal nickel binding domain family [Aciduliprofundum boonei T469]EDY36411.1 NikR C terminal nickel binding domain family [Aciduliprofundum boonei T469]HII55857.1 nickel-responsive transcriptional regulator NikR [Candidatus Aciduliprofundum boonei]
MIQRFGVSIDDSLLKKFDDYIMRRGYISRSEAIRDLIRDALIENTITSDENVDVFGTITMIYDHEVKGITEKITHIQHSYVNEIRAAVHVHVDERNCLEVVILHGKSKVVREIADKLGSLKGVKNLKFQLTIVEP